MSTCFLFIMVYQLYRYNQIFSDQPVSSCF